MLWLLQAGFLPLRLRARGTICLVPTATCALTQSQSSESLSTSTSALTIVHSLRMHPMLTRRQWQTNFDSLTSQLGLDVVQARAVSCAFPNLLSSNPKQLFR